jgi:hypothetical protein
MKTLFLPAFVLLSATVLVGQRPAVDDVSAPLLVLRSGKWGFIDRSGRIVIEPQFDEAGRFSEGLAAVRSGSQWGYIDIAGTFVLPLRFTIAREFSEGLAHVRWHHESGTDVSAYIDRAGETVFVCEQGDPDARMTSSRCGRPFVGGFVKEAIEVFRCLDEPDNPRKFPCRRQVMIDRFGFYDKSGRLAIPGPFSSGGGPFVGGLAAVVPYGQRMIGFIDSTGTFVIPFQFEQVSDFSEGLAAVRVNGRWGVHRSNWTNGHRAEVCQRQELLGRTRGGID